MTHPWMPPLAAQTPVALTHKLHHNEWNSTATSPAWWDQARPAGEEAAPSPTAPRTWPRTSRTAWTPSWSSEWEGSDAQCFVCLFVCLFVLSDRRGRCSTRCSASLSCAWLRLPPLCVRPDGRPALPSCCVSGQGHLSLGHPDRSIVHLTQSILTRTPPTLCHPPPVLK